MNDKLKIDDALIKALEIKEVRRVICDTDKGMLNLVIRKGETRYFLTLDAVPLEPNLNKELMALLFPVKQLEVPTVNKTELTTGAIIHEYTTVTPFTRAELEKDTDRPKIIKPKGRGRPVGSKNR